MKRPADVAYAVHGGLVGALAVAASVPGRWVGGNLGAVVMFVLVALVGAVDVCRRFGGF